MMENAEKNAYMIPRSRDVARQRSSAIGSRIINSARRSAHVLSHTSPLTHQTVVRNW